MELRLFILWTVSTVAHENGSVFCRIDLCSLYVLFSQWTSSWRTVSFKFCLIHVHFPSLGKENTQAIRTVSWEEVWPNQSHAERHCFLATSSHYEQHLTHQKRKTEWLLRATVSRGVAGIVAVMVCFSDFFIAIAIGGESLCFLRMWVRQEWTIFLNVILKSWLRQP